jgi:transposase-like protein
VITDSHLFMSAEHHEGTKFELALAIAQGASVRAWARAHNVPRSTAHYWARHPKVRELIETCRRRSLDRVIGIMAARAPSAVEGISTLANQAESESVRLTARRTILSEMIEASKYSDLESRMANLEECLRERAGNTDLQG